MEILSGIKLGLYKKEVQLDSIEWELAVGAILGDGNLRFVRKNRQANLIVDHGIGQKDYVLWKYRLMERWVMTPPKELYRVYHKNMARELTSVRFSTISHPEFTALYNLFYKEGVKTIPENISEILVSPFSLAVWFMDDGNKNHQAVFLNTQQFSVCGQKLLQECLLKNFNLHSKLNKHCVYNGKQFYRIRITTESTKVLYGLIKNFVIPSLQYKFPQSP